MFDKHEVGAMVGHSYEWYQYRDSYLTANGFVNEALGNENMGAGEKANNIPTGSRKVNWFPEWPV